MYTQVESLLIFTFLVAACMALFHFRDQYIEKRKKKVVKKSPTKLSKDFNTDFNRIESIARVSYTAEDRIEVDKLIDTFEKKYSHYKETRYNVQILQCINRMNNKGTLTYKFEFQN